MQTDPSTPGPTWPTNDPLRAWIKGDPASVAKEKTLNIIVNADTFSELLGLFQSGFQPFRLAASNIRTLLWADSSPHDSKVFEEPRSPPDAKKRKGRNPQPPASVGPRLGCYSLQMRNKHKGPPWPHAA